MNAKTTPGDKRVEILIVEDSPTQSERLEFILEQRHYGVTTAANGKQALALLGEHAPALIITDIVMPEMNGFELCRRVKADERFRDIPVILLTSLVTSEDVLEGLASGADSFISKPYSEDYLLANLQQILANRRLNQSGRVRIGVEIRFGGRTRFITADQQQMLTLLISTYEAAVHRNAELAQTQEELRSLNDRLEVLVAERTAALSAEIAERKRTEEALRASEKRFSQLAEQSRTIIWEVDTEGLYTYLSDVSEAVWGYRPEEIVGKMHFYDIHPEEGREAFKTAAFDIIARREGFRNLENPVETKDGRVVWVLTNGIPMSDASGEFSGYRGSDADITERKRAEEEREKLEGQLRQAQKMEAVGQLAGGVAHDFNNILQSISGYSQLLLDCLPERDESHGFAAEIVKGADRAAALTRQLLAFARRQTIAPKVFDLNNLVAAMLNMLGRLIGEDIDLLWKPLPAPLLLKMDPGQIDQILANLVVNARDAIDGVGKVTIETATAEFDDEYCACHAGFVPGRYVILAVSDDGSGIDKESLAHIFEPFFTTKEPGKGTGLGLAMVFGIVKQNQGFINVYSEPGKGTTFRIYLPGLGPVEALDLETRETPERKTGTETVLLVEDEQPLLVLAARLLESLGYTVLAADRPAKAIQMFREYSGDIPLLITDIVMPEMNGRDLWRELVALRPDLKCLYVSGYTADAIAHRGVLDDGVNFLQKPFTIHDLATKLREILDD